MFLERRLTQDLRTPADNEGTTRDARRRHALLGQVDATMGVAEAVPVKGTALHRAAAPCPAAATAAACHAECQDLPPAPNLLGGHLHLGLVVDAAPVAKGYLTADLPPRHLHIVPCAATS